MKQWSITFLALGALLVLGFMTITQPNIPSGWPKPTYDFTRNPPTEAGILLGRTLFFDPILSADSTISCASCHSPYHAFAHVDHALSHGIDGEIGTRNAPTLQNLAWENLFMWDGAINHLDAQPLAPLSNPIEMREHIGHVLTKLKNQDLYRNLFKNAFGNETINSERFLKAMSQFMLTLVSANSRYDQMKRGELVFSEVEQTGYTLFKQYCNDCHTEPLFTNHQFANNGLKPDTGLSDMGRMKITQQPKDSLCFKVPTLRNIEFSHPYMHDGRFKTLNQVLNHYAHGALEGPTLSPQIRAIPNFTPNQKVELTAFLLTLTDTAFLFHKEFGAPPLRSRNKQ